MRGEDVTQDVQINVICLKNEILRRFVDCLPSVLLPDSDDVFSLIDALLLPFPLLFLRFERDLVVMEDAVQEPVSFCVAWLDSGSGVTAIDPVVCPAEFVVSAACELTAVESAWGVLGTT